MSHFSTVKTELRDRAALIEALRDLGHDPSEGERPVRGYRGQTVQAELAVLGEQGGDIGFRWNDATGSYELVTDLDLCVSRSQWSVFWPSSPSATPCAAFWRLPRLKDSR